MIEGYITVSELAEQWMLKPRTIQMMCNEGRIEGAIKFGRDWAIPKGAERPKDKRIISGNYRNYRKKRSEVNGNRTSN